MYNLLSNNGVYYNVYYDDDDTSLNNYIYQIDEYDSDENLDYLNDYPNYGYESDSIDEVKLLDYLNPLINKDSILKPHALLLLGDYFSFKNEYLKAKDFYIQTLSLKNLQREFYEYARSRLTLILNE